MAEEKLRDEHGRFVKATPETKKEPVDPRFYFDQLKCKKQHNSDTQLDVIYSNCMLLMEKYNRTGQIDAMKKLLFHLDTIEKERKAIAAGIDVFVYLEDIKNYISQVGDKVVKIIELDRYEREVPDDVVAKYEKVKDLFTRFIVVFTDYTSQHLDKAKKERKERDPILFGMFQAKDGRDTVTAERCYFIGDWEDEYCDLTLDKLVSEMRPDLREKGEPTVFQLHDPASLDEIRAKLKALEEEKNKGRMSGFVVNNLNVFQTSTNLTTPSTTMGSPIISYVAANDVAPKPSTESESYEPVAEENVPEKEEEGGDLADELPPEPEAPAPVPRKKFLGIF